jgi:DMSO/TMAO reductase YedYZ molybdopterin-dependent catalytic subunit
VTIDKSPAGANARGAVAGILSGGLALGVAQLVAGLISSTSSPVVAVGGLSIDFTPPAVKNFAIRAFGSHDKVVLVGGILVLLAIFAAVIGMLAVRKLAWGMAGLGVFVLVGLIAALTRPGASASDAVPTLIGGIAAALALRRLARLAVPAAVPPPTRVPARPGTAQPPLPEYRAQSPAGQPPAGQPSGAQPPGAQPPSPEDQPVTPPDGSPSLPEDWRPAQPAARADGSSSPSPGGRPVGAMRPPSGPQRRSFIATGAAVAGVAVVGGLGGKLLAERGNVAAARKTLRIPAPATPAPPVPPGTDLRIPGLSSFITPNSSFYRVDTAIVLPEITPSTWQLRIHGMVAREITLSFDELIRRPLFEDYITLTCVSNPVSGPYIGNAKWLGASLNSLLRQAGVRSGAEQLLCTSSDGFTSGSPVQVSMDGRDSMLAVAMNGSVLPVEHGFPVRMVVPGLYGYVSATKWITDIEVTTYAASRAYWADRGWDQQAPIKTESRIDVPTGAGPLKAGPQTVAGVAWAQHKGVDAVEVRVDKGPWNNARLAAVPGIDTWRQWAWDWAAIPGTHLIESRATDRTGYTQTALQAPPEPNGASGYPQVVVSVHA